MVATPNDSKDGDRNVWAVLVTSEWSDWRNGRCGWIQSVYIDADRRRRGVLRRFYEHAVKQSAAESDVIGVRLQVEEQDRVAQETCRDLGLNGAGYHVMETLRG